MSCIYSIYHDVTLVIPLLGNNTIVFQLSKAKILSWINPGGCRQSDNRNAHDLKTIGNPCGSQNWLDALREVYAE